MVFAVTHGITGPLLHSVTNPSGLKETLLSTQLNSDSFLLIRRADVVSRYQPASSVLGDVPDVNDLRQLCNAVS